VTIRLGCRGKQRWRQWACKHGRPGKSHRDNGRDQACGIGGSGEPGEAGNRASRLVFPPPKPYLTLAISPLIAALELSRKPILQADLADISKVKNRVVLRRRWCMFQ
jgi:hypothetical protein